MASNDETIRYGAWRIYYDPPPIPIRTLDWTYVHDDYDGAEDSGDRRCGYAPSVEACKADIDEMEAEAIADHDDSRPLMAEEEAMVEAGLQRLLAAKPDAH